MFHSFDVEIAKEYGINAAVVFQDMGYWCEHSRINKTNFHDGLYWTYNANHALCEHYPYMSSKAIRTAIQKLEEAGLIVTGNYNKMPFDRTMWYALTEYGCTLYQGGNIDFPKRANDNFPKGQMTISQKGKPIPNTYNSLNTNIDVVEERAREEELNPYGNDNQEPIKDTVQLYASNNLQYMSPTAMQELNSFIDDLNEDVVRHAIDSACEQNVRTWAYTKAILNRYVDSGIKTVGAAKASDEEYKKRKNAACRNQSAKTQVQIDSRQTTKDQAFLDRVFSPYEI